MVCEVTETDSPLLGPCLHRLQAKNVGRGIGAVTAEFEAIAGKAASPSDALQRAREFAHAHGLPVPWTAYGVPLRLLVAESIVYLGVRDALSGTVKKPALVQQVRERAQLLTLEDALYVPADVQQAAQDAGQSLGGLALGLLGWDAPRRFYGAAEWTSELPAVRTPMSEWATEWRSSRKPWECYLAPDRLNAASADPDALAARLQADADAVLFERYRSLSRIAAEYVPGQMPFLRIEPSCLLGQIWQWRRLIPAKYERRICPECGLQFAPEHHRQVYCNVHKGKLATGEGGRRVRTNRYASVRRSRAKRQAQGEGAPP